MLLKQHVGKSIETSISHMFAAGFVAIVIVIAIGMVDMLNRFSFIAKASIRLLGKL